MRGICDDLEAETEALREVVKGLTEDEWRLPTPADGWDTHETVIHLGMADVAASLAVLDPAEFEKPRKECFAAKETFIASMALTSIRPPAPNFGRGLRASETE